MTSRATVVFQCVGCRSLAEPLKSPGARVPLVLEWGPLSANVAAFFVTMPSAFYEMFKGFLEEWPERFPDDDDLDED